jgi:hypothetical protein
MHFHHTRLTSLVLSLHNPQILRLQKKQEAMRQARGVNDKSNTHETRTAVAAAI